MGARRFSTAKQISVHDLSEEKGKFLTLCKVFHLAKEEETAMKTAIPNVYRWDWEGVYGLDALGSEIGDAGT